MHMKSPQEWTSAYRGRVLSRVVLSMLALIGVALVAGTAGALSVEQLETLRSGSERLTVIDIRRRMEFQASHIPGSIHMSAESLRTRDLPPFGRVVIVGDGIDEARTQGALERVGEMSGIEASMLDGGYPAWEGRGRATSEAPGLHQKGPRMMTYAQLMRAQSNSDLLLVDLRHGGDEPTSEELTDLSALLPGVRVVSPSRAERRRSGEASRDRSREAYTDRGVRKKRIPGWLRRERLGEDDLIVLIDDGDGRLADRVAGRLAARGQGRVFVLIGGEIVLRTRGVPQEETRTSRAAGGDE
jgi:rhodanese-related sulfurtransferase